MAVEDNQMTRFRGAPLHVPGRLLHAIRNRPLQGVAPKLAFDHEFANRRALGPENQQVRAPSSQAILPLHASTPVDDPLQERLQKQLRARFPVFQTG